VGRELILPAAVLTLNGEIEMSNNKAIRIIQLIVFVLVAVVSIEFAETLFEGDGK
jgi:hypothetical protein